MVQSDHSCIPELDDIYRIIFDEAAKGIGIFDLNENCLLLNKTALLFLGYEEEDIPSITIDMITHPDFKQITLAAYRQLSRGEMDLWKSYIKQVRKNGSVFWVRIVRKLVRDDSGNPKYIICMGDDITDLKEMEIDIRNKSLQLSDYQNIINSQKTSIERSHKLFLNSNESISIDKVVLNSDGNLVDTIKIDINETFERMLKVRRQNIVGKLSSSIYKDEYGPIQKYFQKVYSTRSSISWEHYCSTNNKYINCSVIYLDIDHLAFVCDDITRQKELENELLDHKSELENLINKKTLQLQQSLENLQNALKQKDIYQKDLQQVNISLHKANKQREQFLSSMSHELRTPLNGIIGFTDMLLGSYYGTLNEHHHNYVSIIKESAENLLSLVNAILDIAKIDADKMEVNIEEFDIHKLLNSVSDIVSPLIDHKNIIFEKNYSPLVSTIEFDKQHFKQIMFNLLSNAIKFTNNNGVICLKTELLNNCAIAISVSDDGIGINHSEKGKIFEEFYQSETSKKHVKGGTGIGLALTKKLVELHNSTIELESTQGKGTNVKVTIPV